MKSRHVISLFLLSVERERREKSSIIAYIEIARSRKAWFCHKLESDGRKSTVNPFIQSQ